MDVGVPELLIVLVIILLLFGPGRLAESGAALGRAMREFRSGMNTKEEETAKAPVEAGPRNE